MRRAFTIAETLVVIAIVGIVAAVATPPAARYLDRVHLRAAAGDLLAACALARHVAIRRSARASVSLDGDAGRVAVHAGPDTVRLLEPLRDHGVRLRTSRDSIAYGPTGLGYGASTATVILERGGLAETLYVSRLGRVRR